MGYELYGVGNALMDLLVEVDEHHFAKLGLKKGTWTLVSDNDLVRLESDLFDKTMKIVPGGSTPNTISTFALLGGRAFFCGKVGNDHLGEQFKSAMKELGVKLSLSVEKGFTGRALTFITPDYERTFALNLGVAVNLKKGDVDVEALADSDFLHVGGNELEDPSLKEVIMHSLKIAKKNKVRISIDLADPGIIKRIKNELKEILVDYADIIFANQAEAEALTDSLSPEEALEKLSKMADIAIIKLGRRGSIIKQGNNTYTIKGVLVNTVDTTGAGDAYAGAFLYALAKEYNLQVAGDLGSYMAATVVSQIGARLAKKPDFSHIIEEED